MNLADIRTLLDFHYWARTRALDAADRLTAEQWTRDLGSSFRSVRDTCAHTFSAEVNWLLRLNGISPTGMLPFDRYPEVATLRHEWTEHEAKMRAFVEAAGDAGLGRIVDYRLFSGEPSRSRCWQILQHVVNHATYHRGQVTTMLRQLGVQPAASMDLIRYYRKIDADPH